MPEQETADRYLLLGPADMMPVIGPGSLTTLSSMIKIATQASRRNTKQVYRVLAHSKGEKPWTVAHIMDGQQLDFDDNWPS